MQSEPRIARNSVWALSLSLAATHKIDVSFSSSGYLDVSVHRVPSVNLWIQLTVTEVSSAGFPHSDICGSQPICSSPQLFAAYHVFLRLLVPRHPPCALISLTCSKLRSDVFDKRFWPQARLPGSLRKAEKAFAKQISRSRSQTYECAASYSSYFTTGASSFLIHSVG